MNYEPYAGDLVWVDLNPSVGREQGGRRPCLIVSEHSFWQMSGMAMLCPVTSTVRPFPSSVVLPAILSIKGEILTGQARFIDTQNRPFKFSGERVPPCILAETREKLAVLIGME